MAKTTMVAGLVCAGVLAAAGCKKEDGDKGAAKMTEATEPTKAEPPKVEPPKVEPPKPMTPDELAKRYQECWGFFNGKNEAEFATCYAEDATVEMVDSGMPAAQGRDAAAAMIKPMWAAFPDLKGEQALILVNGKKIASLDLVTGTHSGELKMGPTAVPATNKKVGYMTAHLVEMAEDNTAHKMWIVADQATMMGQLGMHPMPVRPVMEKLAAPGEVVIAKDDDAERANLEAHKQMAEMWNKKDKAVHGMMAADAVMHDLTSPKDRTGTKELTANTTQVWKGFPDSKGEIVDAWAAGPYTVAVMKNTGTNTGDVKEWKLKKTGKPVSFTSVDVYRWEGGKVKEGWWAANGMAMMQQLGMMPPIAPPAGGDAAKAGAAGAADEGAAAAGEGAAAGDEKAPANE